jgi:hypothetical protein
MSGYVTLETNDRSQYRIDLVWHPTISHVRGGGAVKVSLDGLREFYV